MRRALLIAALPLLPCLGACAQDAEAGTPAKAGVDEIVGVSLEAPPQDQPTTNGADTPDTPDTPAAEGTEQPVTGGGTAPESSRGAIDEVAAGLPGGGEIKGIEALAAPELVAEDGVTAIAWRDLSLEGEAMEDILDKLLYPDQYEDGEFDFPERIKRLDGKEIAIVGYQIPLEWEGTTVPEFMLVGDLLGCCFGGAPMPDQWIEVKMKGKGADYFPYIPVIVRGVLRIEGIEDEAGYAAGCYHILATSVRKEL